MINLRRTILLISVFIATLFNCNISLVYPQNHQYPSTIKCTILSLQAKSSDSCNGKMDFYGSIYINNQYFAFNNILEGNVIYPQWSGIAQINSHHHIYNWINITIRDEDDTLCGGGDDIVDISPANYIATLALRVDSNTGNVWDISDSQNQPIYIGKVGQQITLQGFDSYTSVDISGLRQGHRVEGRNENVETGLITLIVEFQ